VTVRGNSYRPKASIGLVIREAPAEMPGLFAFCGKDCVTNGR
jgi:hypothetical protein